MQNYDPSELVHVSGNTYCTREHDSLRISNGKWYWFSRGFGGKSALDYLINVKEYSLPEAVEMILGRDVAVRPSHTPAHVRSEPKELVMPELTDYPGKAAEYLKSRGISSVIITSTCKVTEEESLWDVGMVRRIIQNYSYTGAVIQGKREQIAVGSKFTRKVPKQEQVIIENVNEAI